MNKSTIQIVVAVLAVIGFSGATAAVVHHNDQVSTHNAMMQADAAMKRTEAAKKVQADAAMKRDEAAKAAAAATGAPAAGDAMAHDTPATATAQ
jgi:hypothetical protein